MNFSKSDTFNSQNRKISKNSMENKRKSSQNSFSQTIKNQENEKSKNILISYFEQSGIHGFSYFSRKQLHFSEKFGFWLLIILVAIYFCIIIGIQSIDRYDFDSTVVSIEKDYYFWNRTTPSITICPLELRLNRTLFETYAKSLNITDTDYKENLFKFLESLANSTYINFKDIKVFPEIENFKINSNDYMELIYNLTGDNRLGNDDSTTIKTNYKQFDFNIQQIITEYGICYVINNYFADYISVQNFLFNKKSKYKDPEEQLFKIDVFGDITYNIHGFLSNIKIFIHNPLEVVTVNSHSYISTEKTTFFEAHTLEVITEENFQSSTTVSQRKCRFPHESNLTHFSVYTKNICLQECRIEAVFKLCKCIPHFYPNPGHLKRVCNYTELLTCFPKYTDEILRLQFQNISGLENFQCYCYENCRESRVIIGNFKPEPASDIFSGYGVIIIIEHFSVVRYKRQVIFTFEDLLISIGGTAGFFLGFSVLSAVEVIYYFTLRLFWFTKGYK